ncbi:MAG: indolepyruvate ferredoxin oxidoreductase subunit alpha [Nanoarchaeota archaeon]|nr:indolepyruvate ferredoxin oxidoreductase subunit alpha [Nanoarchaeota archaeon]
MVRTHRVTELEEKKVILLGNEAIVRGALEAGVGFASSYPGTPSSEIPDTFFAIRETLKERGIYFEYGTNEKCSTEAAAGAAFSGVRSITSMKHFGMNVATDSVFPLPYHGIKAGMVIAVADDPGCWSSGQSEQDSRWFPRIGHMPMIEPSDPQECKDFTKFAFELSEKFKVPVFVRLTTRVSHVSGIVKLDKLPEPKTKGKFTPENKWNTLPPTLLKKHTELHGLLDKIRSYVEKTKINQVVNKNAKSKLGIVANGVTFHYVMEALKSLKLKVPVLKLGLAWPFPNNQVKSFIKGLGNVLVVEELEPILEDEITRLAKEVNPKLKISGKDLMSFSGEYKTEMVEYALKKVLGEKTKEKPTHVCEETIAKIAIKRSATFCPGCPHRSTFYAAKTVSPKGTVFGGDIGCYIIGIFKPMETQDFVVSMGAGSGISHGISKVSDQQVIAFVGDSTFFHGAMPQLVSMVYNKSKPLVIALDNRITAMTGHQPNPSTGFNGMGDVSEILKIEDIAKSFSVKDVAVVNSFNMANCQAKIKEFLDKENVSVIVSRGECRLKFMRDSRHKGVKVPVFEIDKDKCIKCGTCLYKFGCPAIQRKGLDGDFYIDPDLCWGCSVCGQVCPAKAIHVKAEKK